MRVWQPVGVSGAPAGRRRHAVTALAGLVVGAGMLVACTDDAAEVATPGLRIAVGAEPEAQLLGRTEALLLAEVGIAAEPSVLADGRSVRQAIELGDAELAVAYSGEEWLASLGRADPPADPAEAFVALVDSDGARGLTWLVPPSGSGLEEPPANATFAFFVAGPPSAHADLRTLSELSLRLSERSELSLCVDTEFGRRDDGLASLLSTYSVRRDRPFLAADPDEAIAGVRSGDCVAGLSHATDGQAWRAGMHPLLDDLRVLPAFVPALMVRSEVLAREAELAAALRPFIEGLSTGLLGRANGAVLAGADPDGVAADLAAQLQRVAR